MLKGAQVGALEFSGRPRGSQARYMATSEDRAHEGCDRRHRNHVLRDLEEGSGEWPASSRGDERGDICFS